MSASDDAEPTVTLRRDRATNDGRGILYPARLPTFHRIPAPQTLAELVQWFWVPSWDVAPGRTLRQTILPFPASNLVVEADRLTFNGPTTGVSQRDLRGQGWAVGALLRPAASAALGFVPGSCVDLDVEVDEQQLLSSVRSAMESEGSGLPRHEKAASVFAEWLRAAASPITEAGRRANDLEALVAADRSIVNVTLLAARMGYSVRSVQRLSLEHIGLPPLAVIRRYRLQEASQRLHDDPSMTVGQVAAQLGYADHAHLDADFRTVLGFSPTAYRRSGDSPAP